MHIIKVICLVGIISVTGCATASYHPWLHDGWHMHHCRNGSYSCEWWQPISKNSSELNHSELNNQLAAKPFQECKKEMQSTVPIPATRDEAEEIVKKCMAKKGWEHLGLIGSP